MNLQETPNTDTVDPAATPPADAIPPDAPELVDRFLDLNQALEPLVPEPLMPAWTFLQDYPLLLVLVMAGLGYGVGKALQWFLRTSLSEAARRTSNNLDDRLVVYLTAPVVQTGVILGLVAATKAFGFSDGVDHVLVRLLFSALMVGLITSGLKLGDRSQLGALVLAASLVGNLLLMIAVSVWAVAEGGMDQAVSTGLMVTIVSLGYGALAANAVSVAVLVSDTLMSRQ